MLNDLWLIDKPLDWTSFDVVAKVRNAYSKQLGKKCKVGHAGTLDPKATGLLLIAVGKKTKEIASLEGLDKEYTGEIKLGATTKSYDTETEEENSVRHLSSQRGAVKRNCNLVSRQAAAIAADVFRNMASRQAAL
jgi:tRNA pseudouridine55 synthase